MIDCHYGHLARDGREHAIKLLDAFERAGGKPVDVVDAALDAGTTWSASTLKTKAMTKQGES